MRIITRAEWGARPPRSRFLIKTPTPKLYLHHAAGAITPGDDKASVLDYSRIRSIQNYHMDSKGWSDIAYSYLMDPDGFVFEGRGAGVAGGHTAGQNTVSHAICIMGHYDIQPVDPDLVNRLVEFIVYGFLHKWWPIDLTGGHRDAPGASTSCPGKNLYALIPKINQMTGATYMAGWKKPGDPVVDKSDIKEVHRWQGNRILNNQDIDYDENDPKLLDERHLLIEARIISEFMKSI